MEASSAYSKRTWPHDGSLESLPAEWQRELVALMLVDRDVNNGAYLQFFANTAGTPTGTPAGRSR